MNDLTKIAKSASPETAVQFRMAPYGRSGIREFLRDVVAMANAAVDGARYIITGVGFDEQDRKCVTGISRDDVSEQSSYQSLVADFIEPPIRIRHQPIALDGKTVGVFEIGDCQDKPYMMRVDQSERLRRGDAYVRVKDAAIKMGRRQLQQLFERKFRDSVSADRIEIGFPGEIIHKDFRIPTTDIADLPSEIAGAKLRQFAEIRQMSSESGSNTMVTRLTHARLFGADSPYEHRSPEDLEHEMAELKRKHRASDDQFLFRDHVTKMQLVVYNQGDEAIENASLSLVMPNHGAFFVASQLPQVLRNGKLVDRGSSEQADYPVVNAKDNMIQVSSNLGDVPACAPVQVFSVPLRVCAGSALRGKRMGMRYFLFGRNLRSPVKGKLRLVF